MANQDNVCSNLDVPDVYSTKKEDNKYSIDILEDLLDKQKRLQEEVYFPKLAEHVSFSGTDFKGMTLKQIKDFFLMNKHALDDEIHEMFDALGGIHDGIGSGVWKTWKSSHKDIDKMTLDDLSERDRKELVFEYIDAWHFFMNFGAALRVSSQDIYNYYYSKNAENIERQLKNY